MITGHDFTYDEDYELDAYIPDSLPDQLENLPGTTVMAIAAASTELGRLAIPAALVPNPQLLARVATRREAIGTSALEGTYANLTDVFAAELVPPEDLPENETSQGALEVVAYARAADLAYDWIDERPISVSLLSALQKELVAGPRSDNAEAGMIRAADAIVGKGPRVSQADYVPPPGGDQLRSMVENWVEWVNSEEMRARIPIVARLAMAHYKFEAIHPYRDGNGRLGRLLTELQLLREGELSAPVLSISPWLRDRGDAYRAHLFSVSKTGEWAPWIEFFANGIAEQAKNGRERILDLLTYHRQVSADVPREFPRARLTLEIAQSLIAFPMLSVRASQSVHGRSNEANRRAIAQLCDIGVLEPFSEARYGRLYWSPAVFQIIEG